MTRNEVEQFGHWLRAHRSVWAGWPTTRALDEKHILAERIHRLRRGGYDGAYPVKDIIDAADDVIADIRIEDRASYVKQHHGI